VKSPFRQGCLRDSGTEREGNMVRSIEATIKIDGQVVLDEEIKLKRSHRAIVTILDENEVEDVTLMSEDAAWAHLQ
jgi:hypothetical protein